MDFQTFQIVININLVTWNDKGDKKNPNCRFTLFFQNIEVDVLNIENTSVGRTENSAYFLLG